jgi:hypothetical protein
MQDVIECEGGEQGTFALKKRYYSEQMKLFVLSHKLKIHKQMNAFYVLI